MKDIFATSLTIDVDFWCYELLIKLIIQLIECFSAGLFAFISSADKFVEKNMQLKVLTLMRLRYGPLRISLNYSRFAKDV